MKRSPRRRPDVQHGSMRRTLLETGVLLLTLGCCAANAAAPQAALTGVVVDDRTERPIAGVLVYLEHEPLFVETDAQGRFALSVAPGRHTISASVIGYAVLRTTVDVPAGGAQEVMLRLSEGAGTYSEHITVVGTRREREEEAPGGSAL